MEAVTSSFFPFNEPTIPFVDPSEEEHIMIYNISSILNNNASAERSPYVDTLPGLSTLLYTTHFPLNVTFEEMTMLTSAGRPRGPPFRPRRPVSFMQMLLINVDSIVMPAALSIGILGNFLLILVFMCTPLKASALSHYLTALGVSDFINLLSCLAVWITNRGIKFHNTTGVCQVTLFALMLSRFLATWYLFAAHAERVAVHFGSRRARKWCTVFRSKCIIICIFVFSLVGFSHYIWTHEVSKQGERTVCLVMKDSLKHLMELSKVEIITAVFLPMLLILIIDISLFIGVVAKWSSVFIRTAKKQKDKDIEWRGEYTLATEEVGRSPSTRSGDSTPPPPEFDISKEKVRATVLVVIAGLIFIGLVLPASVYRAKNAFSTLNRPSQDDMWNMRLSEEIVKFNCVYKIFLYAIMLKSFRNGLVHFFKHGCKEKKEEEPSQETSV